MLIISGGGIGGLAAQVALTRAGIDACVLERAIGGRPRGGALLLWSHGVRILQDFGLRDFAANAGETVHQQLILDAHGRTLNVLSLQAMAGAVHAPTRCVLRAELLAALTDAVGARLECGLEVHGIQPQQDGVAVVLANGETRAGRGLVAADGIHSTVRGALHGQTPLRSLGQVIVQGLSDASDAVPQGTAVATLGNGARFWACRCGNDRVYWYATLGADVALGEDLRDGLRDRFRSWHPAVDKILAGSHDDDLRSSPARDLPQPARWGRGPVTLLGDAAHACAPDLAQGACMALEDAAQLAACMGQSSDVEAAMRAYEAVRMQRTLRLQWASGLASLHGLVSGPLAVAARDWTVAHTPPLVLEQGLASLAREGLVHG